MTIIEELEKAIKETAEAGVEMLHKSQMGFDFSSPAAHDHHVAYTRTNAAGTASQIKQKGTAPTPIAKKYQTGPGETYHKGDKARYTGKTEQAHGGTFHEIEMLEGHEAGKMRMISKAPEQAAAATPQVTELIVKKPAAPTPKTDIETAHEVAQTVVTALKVHGLHNAGVYIVEYPERPDIKPQVEITTGEDKYEESQESVNFTKWWSANQRRIKQETGIEIGLQSSIGMDSEGVTTVKEPGHYADHIRDTTAARSESSRGLDAAHGRGTGSGGSGTAWR